MKIRAIVFLLLGCILTGCVAVVVAGAVAMVGYDRRSLITMESDARIFHKVHTAIVKNPSYQDSHINVSSFNNVVLLVGQTPKASLRLLAAKIAQQTPNVKRVYNEITVNFPISMQQRAIDSLITSKVRSLLLTEKGLESGSIRIITENGAVYLMGIVNQEQANLAAQVARQVAQVRKVVKVFQYII